MKVKPRYQVSSRILMFKRPLIKPYPIKTSLENGRIKSLVFVCIVDCMKNHFL